MLVPVDSAADWEDIWREEEDFGDDWETMPADQKKPLNNRQMALLESELIRNVQFHEELGSGSFGQVYGVSVYLPKAGRRVQMACKIIRAQSNDIRGFRRALNEMRILRYLSHENICNMNEVIGIPDQRTGFPYALVCLFIELCDGDLLSLYRQYPGDDTNPGPQLPNNLSRHWFAQALRGLVYLHSRNIVHNDIKPTNIVYKVSRNLTDFNDYQQLFLCSVFKLTDFGLSKDAESSDYADPFQQQFLPFALKSDADFLSNILRGFAIPTDTLNEMLEFINWLSLEGQPLNAAQYHEWFQENDEPLTEPFIQRQVGPEIHHTVRHEQYEHWDEIAKDGSPLEGYAPFGRDYAPEKVFDFNQQEWVRQELPVQGVPHYSELEDPRTGRNRSRMSPDEPNYQMSQFGTGYDGTE